jgi:hypothetical protein
MEQERVQYMVESEGKFLLVKEELVCCLLRGRTRALSLSGTENSFQEAS